MARKQAAHGGHGWFVTFADLMGLLVSFFVMLVAFSTQDREKMHIVAGSMRDAFGVKREPSLAALIEVDGLPTRPRMKNTQMIPPELAADQPSPDQQDLKLQEGIATRDRQFALAAASLRQALQELPEIAEISKHIVVTETLEGINIDIVDQEGRSMFPEGAREPYERTRRIVAKLAEQIRKMPYRVSVTGHTAATKLAPKPGYGAFDLSADRANAVRQILQEEGVTGPQIYAVSGRADTEPLFPEDPYMPANRRVSITLMKEAPPAPFGIKP
ncbi:MAG TPA: flagellar motor protein MotB [Xanthobacteraceae bacterium]|nr:flagellar motor protein MotB [Xanthobacteraceae bacterium]